MVEVEVTDDDAVNELREVTALGDVGKIGEAAFVLVAHVHAAVEPDVLAANRDQHAAAADVLARTYSNEHNEGAGQCTQRHDPNARHAAQGARRPLL